MDTICWQVRKKAAIGAMIYVPTVMATTEPRNADADPAFADFNLPLPEQHSPGATGVALATPYARNVMDIENTPANDRLRELAANNPPPPEWLEGEEERLF